MNTETQIATNTAKKRKSLRGVAERDTISSKAGLPLSRDGAEEDVGCSVVMRGRRESGESVLMSGLERRLSDERIQARKTIIMR